MRNYIKNAIDVDEEEDLSAEEIIERMHTHFRSKSNIAVDRVNFNKRKQ